MTSTVGMFGEQFSTYITANVSIVREKIVFSWKTAHTAIYLRRFHLASTGWFLDRLVLQVNGNISKSADRMSKPIAVD